MYSSTLNLQYVESSKIDVDSRSFLVTRWLNLHKELLQLYYAATNIWIVCSNKF